MNPAVAPLAQLLAAMAAEPPVPRAATLGSTLATVQIDGPEDVECSMAEG